MKTVVGRDSLGSLDERTAVAVGTFDGVHVGHRALIAQTAQRAKRDDLATTVLTWDRHPAATLRPEKLPPLLTTPERKVELIESSGADILVVLEFDDTLSHWSPEHFVNHVLVAGVNAAAVFVGRDWRFGHKAVGDAALLERLGAESGFDVVPSELVAVRGEPVSATRARTALAAGDLRLVTELLGRPFDVDGVVVRGDDRGAGLGWPTANLSLDKSLAHPPQGVYAGRARAQGQWWPAAVNVGVNPTFGGDIHTTPLRIEAYLLDFEADLYDQALRLEFWERLRDEKRFDSAEQLSEQIAADVEATRRLTC
ncbi:MAG: bifunctional riboflavin kinase/FAD synthetase [Actinomycetota bacterium]|nr:bifunctional riboflavin kinase/FAD synthetase [Actinomycetota bacterium]